MPWIILGLGALGTVVWNLLELQALDLLYGAANGIQFLREELPPDWSVMDVAWDALVQTLQIAYLGTLFGITASLPFGLLAARNLMPAYVTGPTRLFLAGLRVLPALLWALLFVIVVGPGVMAGVLAITVYTIGYLGKLQYESFEGLARDGLDVARVTGANRLQIARWIVLPESGNALLSQSLFMFEYNVRSSTILGVVGAGGVGFLISRFSDSRQYDRVFAVLLLVYAAVVVIDWLSIRIRARFLDDASPRRGRWVDALAGAFGFGRR